MKTLLDSRPSPTSRASSKTPALTFQPEPWGEALPELRELFRLLWEDVALDQDRFRARCNEPMYAQMAANGFLHLVTARAQGKIVGWFALLILPNGHYADAGPMAFTDMYFLKPEFRKGMNGLRFFRFVMDFAKSKGAERFYTSHKLHRDRSGMFKLLGFKPTDMIYTTLL